DALEARLAARNPIERIASVASFFLSRIDTHVDKVLDGLAASGQPAARTLRGKAAMASACRAYEIYEGLRASPRWEALARRGARPLRLDGWDRVDLAGGVDNVLCSGLLRDAIRTPGQLREAQVDIQAVRVHLLKRREELRNRASRASADLRHESDPLSADFAE